MTCSARFNIQSEGSISQLWKTVGDKTYIHKLLHSSDFAMIRERFYNLSGGCVSQV